MDRLVLKLKKIMCNLYVQNWVSLSFIRNERQWYFRFDSFVFFLFVSPFQASFKVNCLSQPKKCWAKLLSIKVIKVFSDNFAHHHTFYAMCTWEMSARPVFDSIHNFSRPYGYKIKYMNEHTIRTTEGRAVTFARVLPIPIRVDKLHQLTYVRKAN